MQYSLFLCSVLSVQCKARDLWRHHGGKSSERGWGQTGLQMSCRQGRMTEQIEGGVGGAGVGRAKRTARGETGGVRARWVCGWSWCCIPNLGLGRTFCLPLAFTASQKSDVLVKHHLRPLWPNAFSLGRQWTKLVYLQGFHGFAVSGISGLWGERALFSLAHKVLSIAFRLTATTCSFDVGLFFTSEKWSTSGEFLSNQGKV